MSLKHAANHLAAQGRGGDSTLVHMSPGEVKSLQQLAMAHGGSLSVNPNTGLPEAGFLSSILPMVAGAALTPFTGPMGAALIMGGLQTARTGSLGKGLMAGLGAYGGAGLAESLSAAGTSAAADAASANMTMNPLEFESTAAAQQQADAIQAARQAAIDKAQSTPFTTMGQGLSAAANSPGNFLSQNWQSGLMALAPSMSQQQGMPPIQTGGPNPYKFRYDTNTTTPFPQPDVPDVAGLGRAFGRENRFFTGQYTPMPTMAEGGLNLAGKYSRDLPDELETAYSKASKRDDKPTMRAINSENALRERLRNPMQMKAGGGPVEQMSDANAVGANTGFPMADIQRGAYATPYQQPISQNVLSGSQDARVDPYTGQERLAGGGLSHLGDYSDGGRLLRGPGDGVSDSIPATIGGKQPARLADGEFVVPARIVSELGNGSTEAGARKLYAMMDRVQKARGKTTGKGKVAKNTRADKYLPA